MSSISTTHKEEAIIGASPCVVCSLSKLGLPLNAVAGVELYFAEEAENGPGFTL